MNLQDAYYEMRFENAFLREKGESFQTFFERLMGLAYKGDFMPCRPWGSHGDRKNDGFLQSQRRLFQVYAPNEMEATKAISKIREDFEGARLHWGKYFDKWVFAHNAVAGLPPHVHDFLLGFGLANPHIAVEHWGLEEFREVFRKLTVEDRQSWFGPAPTDETRANIGLNDLRVVLESIAARPVPLAQSVNDVPMGKIEANALSESVTSLLKAGMSKAPLVRSFFERWHDETLGERIAESFKSKYRELRETLQPNEVFQELNRWAGGEERGTPEHEVAVLAVLAYYFESCDIFEAPRGDTQ